MIISQIQRKKRKNLFKHKMITVIESFYYSKEMATLCESVSDVELDCLIDEVFSSFLILLLNSNISFYEINVLSIGNSIMLERKKKKIEDSVLKINTGKFHIPKRFPQFLSSIIFLVFFFGGKKTFERRKKASNLI